MLLVVRLHHYGDPLLREIGSWAGQRWPTPGRASYLPLGIVIVAWILKSILDALHGRLDEFVRIALRPRRRFRPQFADAAEISMQSGFSLNAESEHSREELLKRYRQIEDALKSAAQKRCTFLSIDVVGSTQMKIGERATAIAATFQAYEELVRETFDTYGVWKQTWTPDGVMACFLDRDLAVSAGKQVLSFLKQFNEHDNHLRTPFHVRAGLNEGDVSIFEDSSLEKSPIG